MKHKIFKAIEQDIKINNILSHRTNLTDWKSFTRTHFNLIAKEINKNVSSYVQENPILIYDYLLLGKDKVEKLKFDHNLDTSEELIDQLDLTSVNKPFNWISGKTLERYWNELDVKPKDLKLNVLLSYLQVSIKDWEEWKYYSSSSLDSKELNNISNEKIDLVSEDLSKTTIIRALEKQNESLNEYAQIVSHDLKDSITGVKAMNDILKVLTLID